MGDLVNISRFLCECMNVMLGADSAESADGQSQTSDQPEVAGKGVIDWLTVLKTIFAALFQI